MESGNFLLELYIYMCVCVCLIMYQPVFSFSVMFGPFCTQING